MYLSTLRLVANLLTSSKRAAIISAESRGASDKSVFSLSINNGLSRQYKLNAMNGTPDNIVP